MQKEHYLSSGPLYMLKAYIPLHYTLQQEDKEYLNLCCSSATGPLKEQQPRLGWLNVSACMYSSRKAKVAWRQEISFPDMFTALTQNACCMYRPCCRMEIYHVGFQKDVAMYRSNSIFSFIPVTLSLDAIQPPLPFFFVVCFLQWSLEYQDIWPPPMQGC